MARRIIFNKYTTVQRQLPGHAFRLFLFPHRMVYRLAGRSGIPLLPVTSPIKGRVDVSRNVVAGEVEYQ
jgi:hypothetical protein